MKRFMVSLKDNVSGIFYPPNLYFKLGVCYRGIQDEYARGGENNPISDHPDDFDIYTVGVFDDESGEVSEVECVKVCSVSSLIVDKG